jgi:hypothetical protein
MAADTTRGGMRRERPAGSRLKRQQEGRFQGRTPGQGCRQAVFGLAGELATMSAIS